MPYIHLISLGCAKNQVDTEQMLGALLPSGCHLCVEPDDADVILINTCAFIESARQESQNVITECVDNKKKEQTIIVCGCYPQRYQDMPEMLIDGVDYWVPIQDEKNIAAIIKRAGYSLESIPGEDRIRITPPHYAYLRIADGCDHACSFCAIPSIRGKYHSRTRSDIIKEAREMADEGVKELNCIAQDSTSYGRDLNPANSLTRLVNELADINGIEWVRILYMYPTGISDELLQLMHEHPHICPYFDIPLQHISDTILKAMKRPGEKVTRELIERIYTLCPDAVFRTAFITGYPGETEKEYEELRTFLTEARFHHAGVFTYSPEEGTSAFCKGDPVPEEEKERRYAGLMETQQRISYERNQEYIGKDIRVLLDAVDGSRAVGRTQGDAPDVDNLVHLTVPEGTTSSEFVTAHITECEPYDLIGTCNL